MSLRNVLKDVPVTLKEKSICNICYTKIQYTCVLALLQISLCCIDLEQ